MGSFSWLKADNADEVLNVVFNEPFRFLIPKEFGGGYIDDVYHDYGYLGIDNPDIPWLVTNEYGKLIKYNMNFKYDMYELLAFWNKDLLPQKGKELKWSGNQDEFPMMKEIDEYTDDNRGFGIDFECGCYSRETDDGLRWYLRGEGYQYLKYKLKLVSCSYKGTYEDLDNYSTSDPNQGWFPLYRKAIK
jgi:hypothetical protein